MAIQDFCLVIRAAAIGGRSGKCFIECAKYTYIWRLSSNTFYKRRFLA